MPTSAGAVTRLLRAWRDGDAHAETQLLDLMYAELRQMARSQMRNERRNHTLQASALVHEAYLRINGNALLTAENRKQVLALAATAMRHVLVDHARARGAAKRGAREFVVSLDDPDASEPEHEPSGRWALHAADLIALDDALKAMAAVDERQAKIVELRYFTGAPLPEIAQHFRMSERSVFRELETARPWLRRHMDGGDDDGRR
jgi:RNA polymerase sigma factor (TIGR02999 family)